MMTLYPDDNLEDIEGLLKAMISNYQKQKAINVALVDALEDFEWLYLDDDVMQVCPWCGNGKISGHADDCKRQQALALVERDE